MPTELVIIRHGETDWNVEHRLQGQGSVPLNVQGHFQAGRLGEYFVQNPPRAQVMYCSDSLRTQQTALLINRKLDLPIHYDKRLREIDVGQWQGLNSAEVEAWDPERRKAFLEDPFTVSCPDGENYTQLGIRGSEAFQEIAQNHPDEQVLIVSHGALIRYSILRLIPNAELAGHTLNTSLTTLIYDENNGWHLASYSKVPHLS